MRHDTVIADVFLKPAQSYTVTTMPGRKLKFLFGQATIVNDTDLDYVLNLPNATVRPTPRYLEHVALRIKNRDSLHRAVSEIDVDGVLITCDAFADHMIELERLRNLDATLDEVLAPSGRPRKE